MSCDELSGTFAATSNSKNELKQNSSLAYSSVQYSRTRGERRLDLTKRYGDLSPPSVRLLALQECGLGKRGGVWSRGRLPPPPTCSTGHCVKLRCDSVSMRSNLWCGVSWCISFFLADRLCLFAESSASAFVSECPPLLLTLLLAPSRL